MTDESNVVNLQEVKDHQANEAFCALFEDFLEEKAKEKEQNSTTEE